MVSLKFVLGLAVTSLLIVTGFIVLNFDTDRSEALSGSQFKAGNIISNSLFYNGSTMSTSQIQNFLNAKVPSCDTNGSNIYSGSTTRAQYGTSKGYPPPYTCLKNKTGNTSSKGANSYCNAYSGGTKSAAKIIHDVADACGVSQKALLVMLQKEQSLVTDDWPWKIQYRIAMGYGCPDTAACDSEYYGFFNQVYNAAKQFKRYKQNANNYNHIAGRNNSVRYHPNAACGSKTVYIVNKATAGLYNYTPYTPNNAALNNLYGTGNSCSSYGNRNFWRMFNDWFGSTSFGWGGDINSKSYYSDSARTNNLGNIPTLSSGQTIYITIQAKNTGNKTWKDSFVKLATAHPRNRNSVFKDDSWYSKNRPAKLEESSVSPGETGTFKFSITAPNKDGAYAERFRLVADGKAWMEDNAKLQFNITVSNPYNGLITKVKNYRNSGLTNRTDTKALTQDQKVYIKVKAKNTGQNTWSSSVNTRIATVNPYNSSDFFTNNWEEPNRPAYLSESSIAPGQTGTFIFEIDAPSINGTYSQSFQLVSDGQSNGWMPGAKFTMKSKIVEAPLGKMLPGQKLYPGERLKSSFGSKYKAVLQGDGNFVVYSNGRPVWHSHTNNKSVKKLFLQSDGNLVLYKKGGIPLWHTHTAGNGSAKLKMQGDGNLVLYNGSGKPIWHTATQNK